jgi:acetyl-CoA carboxylase biotin carboxyl carrier protein
LSEKKRPKQEEPSLADSSPMDSRLLESLVKLMQANDLSFLELRDGDKRVVLRRGPAEGPITVAAPQWSGHPPAHAAAPPPPAAQEPAPDLTPIKSPMVGTFYAASSPDAKPFVSVGSPVEEETDVCVIEAMKVFNNVKAECKGTIAKILVTNGQAVEFGQVLFLVKP